MATTAIYQYDQRGNLVHRLNADGTQHRLSASTPLSNYGHSAWGERLNEGATGLNYGRSDGPVGFGGQFGYATDVETGLILCGYRYYDPQNGRWLTRDPISYDGGVNVYAYVTNNPMGYVDPYGLATLSLGVDLSGNFWHFAGAGTLKGGVGFSWKCGWTFGYAYGPSLGFGASTMGAAGLTGFVELNGAEQFKDNLGWGHETGASLAYGGKLGAAFTQGSTDDGKMSYWGVKASAGAGGGGEFHTTSSYSWGRQFQNDCGC